MNFKEFLLRAHEVDKKDTSSVAQHIDTISEETTDNKKEKKTLKEYFYSMSEGEQITVQPAHQSTQVIKQGDKVLGTVTNPSLANTVKQAIGKGEMSLAGDNEINEEAPPGMEDWIKDRKADFKKRYGDKWQEVLYATAWKRHNSAVKEDGDKWIQKAVKHPGSFTAKAKAAGKSVQAFAKEKEHAPGKLGKQARLAQTLAKMHEADIPHSSADFGAGLGAGRNPKVLEFKQVNEAMNTLEAAYHEGKSHGLSKHSYACRYDEGTDEHNRYHEGYKEGLDECYGLMPNRGLVVSEIDSPPATVPGMANQAVGEMDKTAYMKQQAIKTPGDTFKAFGQTMHDKDVLETDAFTFESLDKQLNELLTEGEETVKEGLNVNMTSGMGDTNGGEDSVSVTAQGDDAAKLLAFIKQVGLGGLGNEEQALAGQGEPMAATSDYGAPKFGGYDSGNDMMGLLKVMSGGDDYKDEEGDHGEEHHHGDGHEETAVYVPADDGAEQETESKCNECGMVEAECGCEKEVVDEVESEDQMEYQVAEDDGEGYEQGQEAAAQIDSHLPASGGATNEDGAEAPNSDGADAVDASDEAEEEEAALSESSFFNLYKKLSMLAEESDSEEDDKAEKAGEEVAKDIEHDEGHKGKDDDKAEKAGEKVKKDIEYDDKKDKDKEKVNEWANEAGKDGTQQSFERDIEFMTKIISGGLNKPKSTGQQTIPVLAGDEDRLGDEDMAKFRKLAGLGQ